MELRKKKLVKHAVKTSRIEEHASTKSYKPTYKPCTPVRLFLFSESSLQMQKFEMLVSFPASHQLTIV